MEVYATIFMIFVSHVLSSFSSRPRDGRHIPIPKIRRIPIVHFQNHNNDEENQQDIASEYLYPLTAGLSREKITNFRSSRNLHYAEIPDIKSPIENPVAYKAFVSIPEKNKSRLHRKKKYSVTNYQDVFLRIKNELPSKNLTITNNTELDSVVGLNKNKKENSATSDSVLESWANRAKMKYITVRPWNQFCLTCDTTANPIDRCLTYKTTTAICPISTCLTTACPIITDNLCVTSATTCYPYPTKRKKTTNQCSPTKQTATEQDQPWLFLADPNQGRPLPRIPNRPNPTDICSTKTTMCRNKFRSSYLNPEKYLFKNHPNKSARKKRRNYFLASKSQLDIFKNSLKRSKKVTRKSRFVSDTLFLTNPPLRREINSRLKKKLDHLGMNFKNNYVLTRINKLKKRSSNDPINEDKRNIAELRPFCKNRKDRNLTGLPSCQKACSYNLTGLVYAQTIKPPDYFKKQPSLLLCCEDEEAYLATMKTPTAFVSNELDSLEKTTNTTTDLNDSTDSDSSESSDSSGVTDSSSSDIAGTTGSSSDTTGSSSISTASLFRILMQFRNMPYKKGSSVSKKPKDKFYLKLLIRNSEGLNDANGTKVESKLNNEQFDKKPFQSYVMKTRSPKNHPWDARKFCPCSVGKKKSQTCCTGDPRGDKLPWVSTCCYSSTKATNKDSKTTSKSGQSTKSDGNSSTKGNRITTGSGATNSGNGTTSADIGATGITSKATTSSGKATKKRGKTTKKRKSRNKVVEAKGTTSPIPETLSTLQYTVENELLGIPVTRLLTLTEETGNLNGNNLNQPPEEHQNNLNSFNPMLDDENILFVLRVPVSVAQKYNDNGNLRLVLPLYNTSFFPKYVKARSIFEQLLPSMLRRTTTNPLNYALATSRKKSRLPTSVNVKLGTNRSPLLSANVHKHVTKACPSCLKKRKELVFETTNGDKKANCIIDDDNLFYEEEAENEDSNNYEPSTEECDGKYVSYLLKFPKESLTLSSSPSCLESRSTRRGLKVLHSQDSPPKYFIEVPELLAEAMKLEDQFRSTGFTSALLDENSPNLFQTQRPLRHGSQKKPLVLCLQPFGINGHKVYLPKNGVDNLLNKKANAPLCVRNNDASDYLDGNINNSNIMSGFIGKNDSLPFALIPAYLAMQPNNPSLVTEPTKLKLSTFTAGEDQKFDEFSIPPADSRKKEDIPLTLLLNNLASEKKPPQVSKLVKGLAINSLPSKMTPKPSSLSWKQTRKPVRSPATSNKPTYIILMKDIGNVPLLEDYALPLDEFHSSTLGQKDDIFIEPIGEYLN